jgi:hypothetical protein
MTPRRPLKSALHHWWPRCVSRLWEAADGKVGWIQPDGTVKRVPSERLGAIGNAHQIKLGAEGEETEWDADFENEFDPADSRFAALIEWLESLERQPLHSGLLRERFLPQPAADSQLKALTESVVSLAVRSPRNREASVALAETMRGKLEARERESLIGANMMWSQRTIVDSIGSNAKYAVLFSEGAEFIFGDGFFHNITAVANRPLAPKILAPITPSVSVVITRPVEYMVEPKLCTIVLTDPEVAECNQATQIYSRNALYFRSQQPELSDAFRGRTHQMYSTRDNPIDALIQQIPGIPARSTRLDGLQL